MKKLKISKPILIACVIIVAAILFCAGYATGLHYGANTQVPEDTITLDSLIERMNEEINFSQYIIENTEQQDSVSHEYLVAIDALNIAGFFVSAPLYGYKVIFTDEKIRISTFENVIRHQAGICNTSYQFFVTLVDKFNIEYRSVQFYLGTDNHIAAEIWYNGKWHYFDPTWGIYFLKDNDVLSVEEIQALPDFMDYVVINETLLWSRVVQTFGYNPVTAFFQKPGLLIEYNKVEGY
jgi:hypothetical protein